MSMTVREKLSVPAEVAQQTNSTAQLPSQAQESATKATQVCMRTLIDPADCQAVQDGTKPHPLSFRNQLPDAEQRDWFNIGKLAPIVLKQFSVLKGEWEEFEKMKEIEDAWLSKKAQETLNPITGLEDRLAKSLRTAT